MLSCWAGPIGKTVAGATEPRAQMSQESSEVLNYILETADTVARAASKKETMHVSQSFSGSKAVSGVVVCYVTCPHDLVLDVQQAVDAAVCDALKDRARPMMTQ